MPVRLWAAVAAFTLATANPLAQAPGAARPGGVAGAPAPGQPITPSRDTAQPPQAGTGRIRGRVIAAGTNTPLRRVQVVLQGESPQLGRVTNTDAAGRYEFTELPSGRYSVSARRPGYVGLQYGQRRPFESGTRIALSAGETIAAIDFALPRGSVIAGRITDEGGEAMPQVRVQVQRFQYAADGGRRLTPPAGTDTTDDRGEFRIYGLMPGEYVVNGVIGTAASQANEIAEGYPPTFYPGTSNVSEAQPIALGLGEEISIQFGLTSVRFARISGTVRDSEGRAAAGQVVLLQRSGSMSSNATTLGPDGTFTIGGVPPGDYALAVWRPSADPAALTPTRMDAEAASVPITVTGNDIAGLSITMSKGSVVSGRVIWEGTTSKTGTSGPAVIRVNAFGAEPLSQLSAADLDPNANGRLDEDGNFRLRVLSPRVLVGISTPVGTTGWMLKSVMLNGRDITNTPLDVTGNVDDVRITMTDKLTTVAGRVTDGRGAGVMQYVVVVQPADEMEQALVGRYVRAARPDTNGRFEVRGLSPGRYLATAIEFMEQNRQFSPEFQKQLRRGSREFSLKEGESLTLDLRLSAGF